MLQQLSMSLLQNLQSSVGIRVDTSADDGRHFTESQALICASLAVRILTAALFFGRRFFILLLSLVFWSISASSFDCHLLLGFVPSAEP